MNNFKDFNIKILQSKKFEGNKIKISKILNREIIVHDFKIEDSKIFTTNGNEKCLQLQISLENTKHVIFSGSNFLIETIKQIPNDGFPFTTTIIEDNNRFIFT